MLRNAARHLRPVVARRVTEVAELRKASFISTSTSAFHLKRLVTVRSAFRAGVRWVCSTPVGAAKHGSSLSNHPNLEHTEESLSEEDCEAIFGKPSEATAGDHTAVEYLEENDDFEEIARLAGAFEEELDVEMDDDGTDPDEAVEDPDWFVDKEFENDAEIFEPVNSARPRDPEDVAADEALVAAAHVSPSSLIDAPAVAAFLRLERAKTVHMMDVSEACSWCKYMVFAEVPSERQLRALNMALRKKIKSLSERHVPPVSSNRKEVGGWVSLDAGDVVIHILTTDAYAEYDLVGLWEERLQEKVEASGMLPDGQADADTLTDGGWAPVGCESDLP